MYRPELVGSPEAVEASNAAELAFDAFREDLIAHLAQRLDVSREVVLARLGDWLLDPVSDARRQRYARANYLRHRL